MQILSAAALVSLITGVISKGWAEGWIEGVSILLAIVAVVSVASFNNYVKEQQFISLLSQVEAKNVLVRRDGQLMTLSAYELLVGDIVKVERG
jgi:P-type E1-E2 ATPase